MTTTVEFEQQVTCLGCGLTGSVELFKVDRRKPLGIIRICKNCARSRERRRAALRPVLPCSVDGCEKAAATKGWCAAHYRRWRVRGDLDYGLDQWRSEARLTEKRCPDCGIVKPRSEYYLNAAGWIHSICKPCRRQRNELWRSVNREADLERKRAYRQARSEYFAELSHRRYWADPEAARAQKRADYAKHRESRREQSRRWRQQNPQRHSFLTRQYVIRRRASMFGAQSGHVTQTDLRLKVAYWGDRCWCCHGPWTEIDHVKPISRGGAHMLCNLRPICRECNGKKNAHWPYPTGRSR